MMMAVQAGFALIVLIVPIALKRRQYQTPNANLCST
jgi:hypothetical protein